jgi:prophage tail gpP-like protein
MTASLDDVVTKQQATIQQLSAIYTALLDIFRNTGTFTWSSAAATTVVTNAGIQANSQILLIPTNAAAATLVGSNEAPYVSARSVGTSFTLSTAAGTAAAGGEQFFYVVITPV